LRKREKTRKIKAVIFDLDGLLIDSETEFRAAIGGLVRRRSGRALSREIFGKLVGKTTDQDASTLSKEFGVKFARGELLGCFESHFSSLKKVRPMPGAVRAVSFFRDAGLKVAVASSSPKWYVGKFLKALGLGRKVGAVVCGNEVKRRKPAPDVYLLAAKRLGVAPADCLAIDDSGSGILAAKRAGMLAVAVPNEYTLGHDFSKADLVVPSLRELIYLGKGGYLAWET
jgi:HAD superfamily hydrolase (TIGR01509 family)